MTESDAGFQRLHPVSPVLTALGRLTPFSVVGAFVLLTTGLGRIVLALGVVGIILQVLEYWRTTYCLTEDRLVVKSGWFERSEKVVSPDRLQQVEVVRALRHQLFGVAEVRITLAGSTSVTLDSVAVSEAARIHDTLERSRRISTASALGQPEAPPPPRAVLLQLDLTVLALGAVTGAGLTVFPVAILALLNQFGSSIGDRVDTDQVLDLGIPVLILLVTVAALVVAVGVMWVRYYGYTLSRSGDDVRVEFGLADRRSSVIPLRRVQRAALQSNVLRRWAGLTSIDASVAQAVRVEGSGSVDDTVPVARLADAQRLLGTFAGIDEVPVADRTHPAAARRRAAVRRSAGLSPLWIAAAYAQWWYAAPAVLVTIGVAIVWADRWYGKLRHGADANVLVAEQGVIFWQQAVQPWSKVQSLSTHQTPTQRRAGLIDLQLHVAGGTSTTTVRDITAAQAAELLAFSPGLLAMFGSVTPATPAVR